MKDNLKKKDESKYEDNPKTQKPTQILNEPIYKDSQKGKSIYKDSLKKKKLGKQIPKNIFGSIIFLDRNICGPKFFGPTNILGHTFHFRPKIFGYNFADQKFHKARFIF